MQLSSLIAAEKIKFDEILRLKDDAPNLIVWLAPIVFFVLLEILFSYYHDKPFYEKKETVGSVPVGIGNILIGLALKALLLSAFVILYNCMRVA